MNSRSTAHLHPPQPPQHHAQPFPSTAELPGVPPSSCPTLPSVHNKNVEDLGCLGNGDGLNVSATYLTASFGGAPAYYSIWLGQACTSSVVVHLLFTMDSFRSMKVSSDRICFTPENYSEAQLVRIDVLDSHSHSNVISHRIYSLDKNYDRISAPCVIVKTKWCGVGALLTFGGPMNKRKAAAAGSKITEIDIHKVIPSLPTAFGSAPGASFCHSGGTAGDGDQGSQDSPWFVSQLACGHNFSLAVVMHQTTMLFSWGMNANGELGISSTTSIAEPQLVTALPMQVHGEQIGVLTISCGKHHAALVTTQSKLFTWGNNKYGQLGHSDFTNRLTPQEVHFALATLSSNQRALRIKHTLLERGGTNVTQAACGAFHTLFVTHQQNILAMGYNQAGQLGIGHRLQQHKGWRSCVPIAVEALRDRSILDIAAGQNHSACVLSNGTVYVWGCGDDGRLGIGRRDCEMKPVLVPSLKECGIKARSIRCGARYTAVISDRDVLYMWGANEFGQLGCGDKKSRYKPCVLSQSAFVSEGVMDVALGEFHSVCVTYRGKAYVWGLDLGGESAQIDQHNSPTLVPLPDGQRAQRAACGWAHTNIVTQSSQDVVNLSSHNHNSLSPSTASSTSSLSYSPYQSANFHRSIERKQLALRKDELVRWKVYAAPWGLPNDTEFSVSSTSHAGWKLAKKSNLIPSASHSSVGHTVEVPKKNSNQSEGEPRDTTTEAEAARFRVAKAFVKQVLANGARSVAQRINDRDTSDKVARLQSPSRATASSVTKRDLETLPRSIFFQNSLQPPELPLSSTVALRSLAASYQHQYQPTSYCQQHQRQRTQVPTVSRATAATAMTAIPPESTLRPIRPQSSSCSRVQPPSSSIYSPREQRPMSAINSSRGSETSARTVPLLFEICRGTPVTEDIESSENPRHNGVVDAQTDVLDRAGGDRANASTAAAYQHGCSHSKDQEFSQKTKAKMEQVQHDHDAAEVAREAADDASPSETPENQAARGADALHVDTNADADVSPSLSSTNATAPTATLTARLSHVQQTNSFASSSNNTASPLRLVATANAVSSSSGASGTKQQVFFIKTSDSPSSIHSERSRHHTHSHSRKVTRDIAALDFLQNIPMRSEHLHGNHHSRHNNHGNNTTNKQDPSDSQNGNKSLKKKKNATDGSNAQSTGNNDNKNNSSSASDGADSMKLQSSGNNSESLAGRRLPGFDTTIVHVPPLFRYRFTTKYPAASAVVRRWEGMTAQQGLLGSRAYFSSGCGYPIATSTIIKYNGNETSALRKRFASVGNLEPMSYDWRGKSYFRLLHATWAACDKDRDSQEDHPTAVAYMANYLDDPEFRQGRHRHVVRGDKNIGPIVSSILLFVKPNDLKEELNKKFQEKHTWLNGDLSLSKIRNLKRETLLSCQRLNLEVATAAMACVYFEKLVLSHFVTVQSIYPQFVNKSNRKLYMAACLLLAAKFNEPKASDAMKTVIKKILEEIDQVHSIPSREVLTAEFTVYAQLSFSLHIPLCEIQPHFTRLLKLIESNPRKYLDEDVFSSYSILVLDEKNAQLRLDAAAGGGGARSFDGETHDEGTDLEALLSDEEEQLGVHGDEDDDEEDDPSLFPWNRVSFAQWWKKRRGSGGGGRRDATAATAKKKKMTVASALSSPIHE